MQVQPVFAAFAVIIDGGGGKFVRRIGGVDIIRQRFAGGKGGKRAAGEEQREADRGRGGQQRKEDVLRRPAPQQRPAEAAKRAYRRAGEREQQAVRQRAHKGGMKKVAEQREQAGLDAPVEPNRRAERRRDDGQKQRRHRPAVGDEEIRARGGQQAGGDETGVERVYFDALFGRRLVFGH